MSGLHKQHRTCRIEFYRKCNNQKNRQKDDNCTNGAHDIHQPFQNSFDLAKRRSAKLDADSATELPRGSLKQLSCACIRQECQRQRDNAQLLGQMADFRPLLHVCGKKYFLDVRTACKCDHLFDDLLFRNIRTEMKELHDFISMPDEITNNVLNGIVCPWWLVHTK